MATSAQNLAALRREIARVGGRSQRNPEVDSHETVPFLGKKRIAQLTERYTVEVSDWDAKCDGERGHVFRLYATPTTAARLLQKGKRRVTQWNSDIEWDIIDTNDKTSVLLRDCMGNVKEIALGDIAHNFQ